MNTTNATLTRGQRAVLGAATVPMIAAGGLGAWGTYTNISAEFGRAATALGVVAAGEGVTLVLALVMVGLTMLGQAAPAPVRAGLWAAPLAASFTGIAVADNGTEAVVYALTPMAMCASAEGLGLLARRIVVHRTGVDTEAQRRNAATVQRLAYHRARAANHPSESARKRSEKASWRLARRVGVGDAELGAQLVEVQRDRLRDGADAALAGMFGVAAEVPELPADEEPEEAPEVTVERADQDQQQAGPERPQLVMPPVTELAAAPFRWEDVEAPEKATEMTVSASVDALRQVVTEVVTLTPNELLKRAFKLNRELVSSGQRPVTIGRLQDEYQLSRREATALRRLVVTQKGGRRS